MNSKHSKFNININLYHIFQTEFLMCEDDWNKKVQTADIASCWHWKCRPFGIKGWYLPLYNVADTTF